MLKRLKYKEYEPKSLGLTYLKRSLASAKKVGSKTILVPTNKLEEAINEMKVNTYKRPKFIEDSNSVRSAALAVCIPTEEMVERLNAKLPSVYMTEIAELKTKISDIEEAVNDLTKAVEEGDVTMYDLQLLKVRAIFRR